MSEYMYMYVEPRPCTCHNLHSKKLYKMVTRGVIILLVLITIFYKFTET